ncbi:general substrate transporter [Dactylonectria estremocensis]|uniref:General substrate transporter n=1 Tax=Dactylonectria estremocensis TaxID=1079267 RepID=A0A9P9ELV8_9HYPO|nr:general substrate transporter [Dactylonectria estremocensis]
MDRFSIDFKSNKWAIIYCGVSTFGALCYGYDQIYYTGLLGMQPFINDYGTTTDSDGDTALTTSFISLTASIIYVGELLGALMAAPINDRWGRKAVFYCASVCIAAGAIVQLTAHGIEGLVILGRILIGLGIGQFTVTSLLYIGEVAPVAIRGPALMMFQFMQSCSQLVGSGITQGTEAIPNKNSYFIPMGLLILLPGLMVLCLPFTPESPTWHMMKRRTPQAEASLRKINRSTPAYDPAHDMNALNESVRQEELNNAESSWGSLFKDPIERQKLFYSCGAMVAQQINGIQFFYSYGVVFAQSIGIKEAFTISLITNVLQVISVAVSVLLGNKISRRKNLWVCSWGIFGALIIVGGLGTKRAFPTGISTAIVVFSYIVIVCFNFSLGPLAFTIASEMAVGRNRNKIMSCSIVTFFFTVWVIAFTSPYLYYSANLGPMLCFVYAGMTVITLAYVWFCVGETRGRTQQQLERFFTDKIPVREWEHHQFEDLQVGEKDAVKVDTCSSQVEHV